MTGSGGVSLQIRMVGAVPRLVLARLQMFFNTNKTFLLPTALPATQLQLQVLIPPLAPRATKNILLINQTYTLFANSAVGFQVPARMITEVGTRHPRVRSIGLGSKVDTLQIDLDLRFLDVTDHVRVSASTPRWAPFTAHHCGLR